VWRPYLRRPIVPLNLERSGGGFSRRGSVRLLFLLSVGIGIRRRLSKRARQSSSNDATRMNHIQLIGRHNSYHAGIAPSETKLMQAQNPGRYQALEYRHRPLDQQLTSGVRQTELDVFADSR